MNTITAYLLPILIVYIVGRYYWMSYISLKYQYKFFALRDELRMLVIEKKTTENDPIIVFFDNVLSLQIEHQSRITVWGMLYTEFTQSPQHKKNVKALSEGFVKLVSKNKCYLPFMQKYIDTTTGFVIYKSIVSLVIAVPLYAVIVLANKYLKRIKIDLNVRYNSFYELVKNAITATSLNGNVPSM